MGRFGMPKSGGFLIAKTPKWRSEIALPKRSAIEHQTTTYCGIVKTTHNI
jgi:hypothetical protein